MKRYLASAMGAITLLPVKTLGASLGMNNGTSINGFLISIRTWLLGFAGGIAVLFIIIGGMQLMIAGGNPQKMETAKKTLTYAVIGLLFVLLAQVILRLITGSIFPAIFTGSSNPY